MNMAVMREEGEHRGRPPVARHLLVREEQPADGRPERRRDAARRPRSDEIALVLVVAEPAESEPTPDCAHGVVNPSVAESPCDNRRPSWRRDGSWAPRVPPREPLATLQMVEMNFTTNTRRLNTLGMLHPFRYAITSGTPLPPASGANVRDGICGGKRQRRRVHGVEQPRQEHLSAVQGGGGWRT